MHQLIDQRVDQRVQRKDFPGIQLDVHRRIGIHGLCIPVDSFDLRCESVTYVHYSYYIILFMVNDVICIYIILCYHT